MSSDWSDLYNSDVTILRTVEGRGKIGSPIAGVVRSETIRGMLQNTSGSESISPVGESVEETFDLFIDFGATIQQADIIEIDDVRYDVISVSDEGGRHEVLKIGLRKMR